MRKMVLLAAMMAMAVMMLAAAPAMADDFDGDDDDCWSWGFWICDDDFDDHGFFFGGNGFGDFEQEADSGDVDQSFNVSQTGDNSNQCVGIQGVANTGNAQNQLDLIQYGSEADDFEFDEVGSSLEVSPSSTTECNQQVNQAATAAG